MTLGDESKASGSYEEVSSAFRHVVPELVDELRRLGDLYGPLGVAVVAARLSDPETVLRRLGEPPTDEPDPALLVPDPGLLDDETRSGNYDIDVRRLGWFRWRAQRTLYDLGDGARFYLHGDAMTRRGAIRSVRALVRRFGRPA